MEIACARRAAALNSKSFLSFERDNVVIEIWVVLLLGYTALGKLREIGTKEKSKTSFILCAFLNC